MRSTGIRDVVRGQRPTITRPDTAVPCPQDWCSGSSRPTARISPGRRISRTSRRGAASCTWPSCSTCLRGVSWAGGRTQQCGRILCSMPSSKPYMTAISTGNSWSTWIAAHNKSGCATPTARPMRPPHRTSAARAMRMTMRSPSPSLGCTRRR
jgi:hypothetical protein